MLTFVFRTCLVNDTALVLHFFSRRIIKLQAIFWSVNLTPPIVIRRGKFLLPTYGAWHKAQKSATYARNRTVTCTSNSALGAHSQPLFSESK